MTPDRGIVAQLKRIDPGLSVVWVDPPGRWGVFHDLQYEGNPDQEIDRLALEIQLDGSRSGYMLDKVDCQLTAKAAFQARKLVCYVSDDDGSYRTLDSRIVKKLERMDYYRRNCGLKDWRSMLDARADALRRSREAAQGDVWECIRRDHVFAGQVSDILWGNRPIRSIVVPDRYGEVNRADSRERTQSSDPAEAGGAEAHGDSADGSGVAEPNGATPGV